nr:hypothetical protein BaRGS_018622 [Batillaria attramentaria]
MDWLFQQQNEMESGNFGRGRQGVLEALAAQKTKASDIRNFRSNVDKALATDKLQEDSKRELDGNYNSVSVLSNKRQYCLETVADIASMEELVQFFHEVEEAEYWMDTTLSRIHLSFDRTKLQGDKTDAVAIQGEIKDVLAAFLQWQTKIDYLFERAKQVVPVPQRTRPSRKPRPVIALTDYSTVRNNAGQEAVVPAVIILIPSPLGEAMDAAIRLRLQLLSLWTGSVKRLGYQLIAFMLLVFRDWNEEEVALLQQLSLQDKEELLRVLKYIESTLQQHWHEYGDFHELQERILRLRMIIEEAPEGSQSNEKFLQTVVVQVKTLEDLLKKYQDFWAFWETYKTIVELIKQPEFLLVCDKWEQLRYITTAHFVKFWDTSLDVADGDITKQTASLALHETPKDEMISSEVTIAEEHQETSTETVSTSIDEEEHTFIITGVLDPRDSQRVLNLQEAIMLGVVDQAKGFYCNPLTGERKPMADAMSEGRILMDFVSKKKIREEKQSYGLITIKITRETRPYTITAVSWTRTTSTYRMESGEKISIQDAIHSGLVLVEYPEDPNAKPEVETKTYAVHGVVDQRKRSKVFVLRRSEDGLLDRDTGEYVNNLTHQKVGVQEAIMRGSSKHG